MKNQVKKEYGIRSMKMTEFNIKRDIVRELNLRGVFTLSEFLSNDWRIHIKDNDVLPVKFNEELNEFEQKIMSIL